MSKRGGVKLKDLKAGQTIWEVDCCRIGKISEPVQVDLKSGVYNILLGQLEGVSKGWHSPFIDTETIYEWGILKSESSLDDRHVGIPNTAYQYNLHRWFTSRKAAMKYYNRLKSDCLTKQERECLERAERQDIEDDVWGNLDYGQYD